MTYIERALSLIVSAGEMRNGASSEVTARAQVYALLSIAGTLAEMAKTVESIDSELTALRMAHYREENPL